MVRAASHLRKNRESPWGPSNCKRRDLFADALCHQRDRWVAKVRTRAFASQHYFCTYDSPENSRVRERASRHRQMAKILHGQDKARGKINRQESSRNHPRQRND